ncbi:MFS transporter [Sphaerisporangium siamense]|uniref:Sugar phosphate permease n=1 Tax=Sphaerisporangium siamense TaxID=795645 RepID=A0A7W7D863_9ACTN|nr:MFS transporter [Sphaerisporangium siamense]MBB4702088.1 sugar phosphate permease [Sphaerisporangium siamense]
MTSTTDVARRWRLHRAWVVAGVAFVAILGAAGFRATPGVLITPLEDEFGWTRGTISLAISVNLTLFGLIAPFAAALMDRLGMRRVVTFALMLVALGSGLTVLMTASWQLVALWGVLVGLGTGSMALVFVATVTDRWFVRHRGVVTGLLTAAGATGQLIFLPLLAWLAEGPGWRTAALAVAGSALAVVPLVWFLMRDRPEDVGLTPLGAPPDAGPAPDAVPVPPSQGGAAARAVRVLGSAARTRAFWFLAGGFAICGASTNGLVGTHFIPAAHDHGMPETMAAGLLALIGVFDIAGTVLSGWLSDRVDPRVLLGAYYALRGASLLILPALFSATTEPSMLIFIVFYGLDWVATVPPTVALCRRIYGADGAVVFGWVFASHQVGAAIAAVLAGLARDHLGQYDAAWYGAGALCAIAAVMSLRVGRGAVPPAAPAPSVREAAPAEAGRA